MKKIITLSMLLVCLTMQQTMHAYYFSPDELGGGNPALREAMEKDPVSALLIICCPCYSLFGLGLLASALENAPSYDRVRTTISSYNCCNRMKVARAGFVQAHDRGLLATLKTPHGPKIVKMKDE